MTGPMKSIFVITGPTASGKTGRSLALAKEIGAAIISADSRMVYQGLDIGTGKPTWEYRILAKSPWIEPNHSSRVRPSGLTSKVTIPPRKRDSLVSLSTSEVTIRRRAPDSSEVKGKAGFSGISPEVKSRIPVYTIQGIDHYLLDIVPPETPFTLTDWLERTRYIIKDLQNQDRPVVVVGGTGLYLKALLAGYQPPPTDVVTRSALEKLETAEILKKLEAVDPVTADRETANRRRLIRALEIYELTGQAASAVHKNTPFPAEVINLSLPRAELFARIDQRIEERLRAGMVDEVEGLLNRGISQTWLIRLGLEYRVCTEWLAEGKKDGGELSTRLQKAIHAYARRQETYLRTQLKVW